MRRLTTTRPSPEGAAESTSASGALPRDPADPLPSLSADMASAVRFSIAEPSGYFFPQVETFVAEVVTALRTWEDNDFRQRTRLHEVNSELDAQIEAVQRLRTEIEIFKVNGAPLVNADGSYVTQSQQEGNSTQAEQVTVALDRAQAAEAALAELQAFADAQGADLSALRKWADEVLAEVAAVQAGADEQALTAVAAETARSIAEQERDDAVAQYRALVQATTAKQEEQRSLLDAQRAEVASLRAALADRDQGGLGDADDLADEQVGGAGRVDLAEEADLAEEVSAGQVPDSELPDGALLPGDGAGASPSYPPSAPGTPLSAASGPAARWAPELSLPSRPAQGREVR